MNSPVPLLALDGPAGAGKGTVSLALARHLGWHRLESGALYRTVALLALEAGLPAEDGPGQAALARDLKLLFRDKQVLLDGRDVRRELARDDIGKRSSVLAALPEVRKNLVPLQRSFLRPPGLVAEGRDMGTVIFPQASLKIFLTATLKTRAQRRFQQLKTKGHNVILDEVQRDMEQRDLRDQKRKASPLLPAADAISVDSTRLSPEAVVAIILRLWEQRETGRA